MTGAGSPARPAPAPLTIADLNQFKATPVSASYATDRRRFYSPIDDVHGALKAVLSSATRSVVVAVYGFDDDELAGILRIQLASSSVHVQITLDKSQAGGVHEKAILAKFRHEDVGNSIAIGTSEENAIMHRKMVIVDGVWLVTGSTNWSDSGEGVKGAHGQDNELTIVRSAEDCAEARPILDIEHDHALAEMQKASAP